MFWKTFIIGFIADSNTFRAIQRLAVSNAVIEPIPSEQGKNYTEKFSEKDPPFKLEEILEKKNNFRLRNQPGSGCDMRAPNISNPDELIFNITQFVFQMKLLTKLESNQVSVVDKLAAIEQYEKDTQHGGYLAELKNGGLWKDWKIDL